MQLARLRETGRTAGVERGGLVRVLAVPQHRGALVGGAVELGEPLGLLAPVAGADLLGHPRGDGHVVGGGVGVRLGSQACSGGEGEPAGLHGGERVGVLLGRGEDGDARVVLGGRTHHGGPADVDLLDTRVDVGAGGHRVGEGVQVDGHELERLDTELGELAHVVVLAGVGEDAGVHARVKGLDAALEALGEPGELLDAGDGQAQLLDRGGGSAGGDERDSGVVQAADQLLQPRLVVDRDQSAAHRAAGLVRGGRGRGGLGHGRSSASCADRCCGTQAGDAGSLTPRWCPTCASRVRPTLPSRVHAPRRTW